MTTYPTWFEETTFYLFLAVSTYFVARAVRNPSSFLTFPVISAAVWLTYLAPQAFGILYYPRFLPPEIYYNGFAQSMIMSTLCLVMGVLGWRVGISKPVAKSRKRRDPSPEKLLYWGILFTILGWLSFMYVTRQSGGILAHYSIGGNYNLDWLGGEVIASFFKRGLFNVGIVLLAFSALLRPRWITIGALVVAVLPSVGDVVLLNRRSDAIYLGIALAGPAFFVRKWVPSRATMLVVAVAGMFVVFTFPVIRGAFLIGAESNINIVDAFRVALFNDVLGGEHRKEFNNSIGVIASADRTGDFGMGRNLWNMWVQTTIPRTFLGQEIKEALKFEGVGFAEIGQRAYGWLPVQWHSYSSTAMLFYEFWYFGSLVFFGIGHVLAKFYQKARSGSLKAKLTYVSVLLLAPHWISVGFAKTPRDLALMFLLLMALSFVVKSQGRSPAHFYPRPASRIEAEL